SPYFKSEKDFGRTDRDPSEDGSEAAGDPSPAVLPLPASRPLQACLADRRLAAPVLLPTLRTTRRKSVQPPVRVLTARAGLLLGPALQGDQGEHDRRRQEVEPDHELGLDTGSAESAQVPALPAGDHRRAGMHPVPE